MNIKVDNRVKRIFIIIFSVILLGMWGCMVSQGTKGDRRNKHPAQQFNSQEITPDSSSNHPNHSSLPEFMSQQDTVQAEIFHYPKSKQGDSTNGALGGSWFYTIQLGAYNDIANALRNQKLAKERFKEYPVFNEFDDSLHLYRVSIGRFSDRESAEVVLRTLQRQFPKEYGKCWLKLVVE
jgi:cell division septation protein DedD